MDVHTRWKVYQANKFSHIHLCNTNSCFQIGTNGMFSFGYRELAYLFSLTYFNRSTADPFWGDVDISNGVGEIKYEIHPSPSVLIDQVSTFISVKRGLEFVGAWMLVCYWQNVPEYGGSLSIVSEWAVFGLNTCINKHCPLVEHLSRNYCD